RAGVQRSRASDEVSRGLIASTLQLGDVAATETIELALALGDNDFGPSLTGARTEVLRRFLPLLRVSRGGVDSGCEPPTPPAPASADAPTRGRAARSPSVRP